MPGALKSFAGVKTFVIRPNASGGLKITVAGMTYNQFPMGITASAPWSLEVAGSLTYNMQTDERTSQISQQGDTVGVSTQQVPAFIEGEFFWHPTEGVNTNNDADWEPQDFLHQQINVDVEATNRGGRTISLKCAHVTEVSDTDAITGTFTCRWEGTAQSPGTL